uniref:Uncharacterized protein n=1 Tax=Parascaris equorum TaxID=6256 RepID=A0A914R841_PAREQ
MRVLARPMSNLKGSNLKPVMPTFLFLFAVFNSRSKWSLEVALF